MLMGKEDTETGNCNSAEALCIIIWNHCRGRMFLIGWFVGDDFYHPALREIIHPKNWRRDRLKAKYGSAQEYVCLYTASHYVFTRSFIDVH